MSKIQNHYYTKSVKVVLAIVFLSFFAITAFNCSEAKWDSETGKKTSEEFISSCVGEATKGETITSDKAKAYCDCCLDKIKADYPNLPKAVIAMQDNKVLEGVAQSCIGLSAIPDKNIKII